MSDLPRRILERPASRGPEQALFEAERLAARFDARSMNLRLELENLERAALAIPREPPKFWAKWGVAPPEIRPAPCAR